MRKLGWFLGCALLLVMGSRIPAQAAGDNELSRNWDFRLGFFLPEREAPRRQEGDIWLAFGVERTFYELERYRGSISIDYYGSAKIYNVPITLNLRSETGGLRFGAGAGFGISHDLEEGILGFAYNLMIGYTILEGPNKLTFDVRYLGLSTGGGQLNGWGFTIGYRF